MIDAEDYENVNSTVENVEQAVRDVEAAVLRVESAIKNRWSTVQAIVIGTIVYGLMSLVGEAWHSKWRYSLTDGVSSDSVQIQEHPHDCAFLAPPIGYKYCHYERKISTIEWATSTVGNPIVSYDDGKTWATFAPDPSTTVPKTPQVQQVFVEWEKKDD